MTATRNMELIPLSSKLQMGFVAGLDIFVRIEKEQ
jgi:hypothetical protein